MRYLVTGGAGFIGSNIVRELLKRGQQVRAIDNLLTGKKENLKEFGTDVEIIEGDIRDFWVTADACRGIDYILHQAALPSVTKSVANPLTTTDINIRGTLNVLEAAKRQGVGKVLTASSSSVYGDAPTLPKHEGMPPSPLSPYAVSKLAAEHYCRVYAELYGLTAISFRYFNVFGPNQDPNSEYAAVIPKFITALLNNQQPVIYGDGEQSRDFTYVDNVVDIVLAACEQEKIRSGQYNLACGGQYTLNQLLEQLNSLLGKNIKAKYTEPRPGDIKHSFADISKLRNDFGIEPQVEFEEGLKRTIAFYKREQLVESSV
ncbi:MAG: SDR family oxidoreductase [candidate division Zixibacteria bacterium]|nr:SDR family oxidoreductase [candidate division Zixibacteria bacterium]